MTNGIAKHGPGGEGSQTLFVDGCKVTLHYMGQENPDAVDKIKAILLSGHLDSKKCENLHK